MNKKIYISGQVAGLDKEIYEDKFNSAEEYLKTIFEECPIANPIKFTSHMNPVLHTWSQYMLISIEELLKCEIIYMLDNWQLSKGAKIELAIAKTMEMGIIYQ